MIPARIDDDRVSAGERRVFRLLENDPATTDWTVLHSLGIARRPTGPYGEIDFVAIIPGEGIICLEVKGGRLSCEEGVWRTMDRHGNVATLKKSPFLQARDSMFALRDALVSCPGNNWQSLSIFGESAGGHCSDRRRSCEPVSDVGERSAADGLLCDEPNQRSTWLIQEA